MRILLLSDSHGDVFSCKMAIKKNPEAKAIIHLGDGEEDLDELKSLIGHRPLYRVRGNAINSTFYGCPPMLCCTIEGKRIYLSHGYREQVKLGLSRLKKVAKNCRADIALYGHTHVGHVEYDEGLLIVNPGSIRNGSFALLDICDGRAEAVLKRL